MPAPTDNVKYFSIIEDSVVQGESIRMRDLVDGSLIMPRYEMALSWYRKYHPKALIGIRGAYEAYSWMLQGFYKEVRAKVFDPESDSVRVAVYLDELYSFFSDYQKLVDTYNDTIIKLLAAFFNDDDAYFPKIDIYQAAVEGAIMTLTEGLGIVNDCRQKLTIQNKNISQGLSSTKTYPGKIKAPASLNELQPILFIPEEIRTKLFKTLSGDTAPKQHDALDVLLEKGFIDDRIWVKVPAGSLVYVFVQARNVNATLREVDMTELAKWVAAYFDWGKNRAKPIAYDTVYNVLRKPSSVKRTNQIRLKQ